MRSNPLRGLFASASFAVIAVALPAYAQFTGSQSTDAQSTGAQSDQTAPPTDQVTTVGALTIEAAPRETPATTETETAAQIDQTVNAVDTEDVLKYLPSLLVRKRHIGDTQAPLATRTSGVGSSARTLVYADGVLLSALIGNNNSTASPRWGMVDPADIASVSFLYGPFSAAYAGNSIGGVLNIVTATPDRLEGSVRMAASAQSFSQYATDGQFGAGQLSGSFGDRAGNLWYQLSGNLSDSNAQPLSYVTVARPAATSSTGTPVTGPFSDVNKLDAPIGVFGASAMEHQLESNLKLRVGYDLPFATAIYSIGRFSNQTDAHAQTYTTDVSGQPVYTGTVNFDGYAYALPASAFSNGVYDIAEDHLMQALSLTSRGDGPWTWNLAASDYDYQNDAQRIPSVALPDAQSGGAGSILRMDGTGWETLDGSVSYTLGSQVLTLGAHDDDVKLVSDKYATGDWLSGQDGALTLQALGQTQTEGLWAQDAISLGHNIKLTLGARAEDWQAYNGFNFSASPALSVHQPDLSASKISPKATLEWDGAGGWSVTGSYGEAYRFPTVTELYQAITTGPTLTVPDPDLKPEYARSGELAVERDTDDGRVRVSLFTENISDALISQTAPLVPNSTTLFSYVQNVDRTQVNGIELVGERDNVLVKGLDLTASATLTDPVVERDAAFAAAVGKQLPGVPRFKATAEATWHPDSKWTWNVAARYSDRVYANIDNSDVVTHTYQGFDSFLVVDTRVSYQIDKHWDAALGVDNIGDRRYFLFHPFPGRTALAELNYKF